MDPLAALAAYEEQVRRRPHTGPGGAVERDEHVVRVVEAGGWSGVTWSDLGRLGLDVDVVVAEQVHRFTTVPGGWEWKHYSHDLPADLPDRLRAAGLVGAEPEALMVAKIADLRDLDLAVRRPDGVRLEAVRDRAGAEALVAVHDAVFGGDHRRLGEMVLGALLRTPRPVEAVVAWSGAVPICAGRVELPPTGEFASIWGGGTLPGWRGRGVFRAVVAHRAAIAAGRGYLYLQVDASADSHPILQRLGFAQLATTTPYTPAVMP